MGDRWVLVRASRALDTCGACVVFVVFFSLFSIHSIPCERVHNVSAVMDGVRHSLVVELWEGEDNQNDRHS